MKFKRDYKIEVMADLNDRTFWKMTRKGEPAKPTDEDKQVVAEMLEEILNKIKNDRTGILETGMAGYNQIKPPTEIAKEYNVHLGTVSYSCDPLGATSSRLSGKGGATCIKQT